jgi:hypothetical protein
VSVVAGHLLQRLNLNLAQWSTQNVSLALLSAFFHLHPHFWWLLYSDRLGAWPRISSRLHMITYDPDGDGKSKLDHVKEMLDCLVAKRDVTFDRALMDSWYGAKELLLFIESLGKFYYVPLKCNRQVDDSGGVLKYKRVDELNWNSVDLTLGKTIKIKGFPKEHKVKLFRVVVSDNRTDWVITNDLSQHSTSDIQKVCAIRWKIEQFHRELKQVTGIEKCQCRKARIQRNHIACAVLVWIRLTELARASMTTVYRIKEGLLEEYLKRELRSPSIKFSCL